MPKLEEIVTGYGALWGDYDVHARLVMIGLRGGAE